MSLVLRKDPAWLETLCSTDVSGGALLTLLGKDGCQVPVPAALLVAVSPLVKSIMSGLLPPAYSPHVISIPAVTADVLLQVAEILSKGRAVVHANKGEVQEVFKMMRIEAFLSYCVADMEVKDEDLPEMTEDCSQSEIYVKIEKSDENKDSEYYEDYGNLAAIKVEIKKIESNLSERNNSSPEVLLPSNESKPEENKRDKECDENVLEKNVRQHPSKCDQCAYRAASSVYFKQHMLVHTAGERTFACDECAHRALSRKRLKQHMLVHSRERPFACDQCSYKAVSRGLLKQHMQIHTKEKLFECDQCDYKTVSRARLKQHMLVHSREKPFACDECAHRALSRKRLKQHILVHSRDRPFACDQCSFKAVSRGLLKQHMQIHTNEKPFACDQCDYKASRHSSLVSHKAYKHGADKLELIKCDECDYRAATSRRITQHMLIHTSDKSFACDQCDYEGTGLPCLKCHKANGHKTHELKPTPKVDEPVHCIHCGKLCKSKKRLEKHMERRHSGLASPKEDEPVHCIHCGKLCKSKKLLETHIQRRHSGLANLN